MNSPTDATHSSVSIASDIIKVVPQYSATTPVAAQYVVTFLKPEMLHIYRQISALREWRPVVLAQKRENEDRFPFDDVRVLPKPRSHQLRRFVQKTVLRRPVTIYRSEARRILDTLHEINAKVLHVYFGHIGVHLLPLLKICDVPFVVSFHGADVQIDLHRPVHRRMTLQVLELARLVLVRSESLAAKLEALGCPRSKIRLQRTGLPLDQFGFTPRHLPADGAWHCVQACRLIPKKGLATSLRAFAKFLTVYPRATLTIAGEGPQLDASRSLARNLGIGEHVFFTGFLSQEKLHGLYRESHLFLHPSELGPNGDQEGVPNSMLEAMACGLPVLATRHGGIPEAVTDGVSGLLFAEHDHAALADGMLSLVKDDARYSAMSVAASERVKADFDLSEQAHTLETIYREAVSLGGSPSR